MYYVVKTAKYGGGLVSKHRKEQDAEKASNRYPKGATGVIMGVQFRELPLPWHCKDQSQLAR